MCTVSVLRAPFSDRSAGEAPAWRLVFNRDERHDRAPALPPFVRTAGGLSTLQPLDPGGHGTWIAATSAGLVFALLNETEASPWRRDFNPAPCEDTWRQGFSLAPCEDVWRQGFSPAGSGGEHLPSPGGCASRGLVIPALLSARSLDEVEARVARLPLDRWRPYRLLAIDDTGVLEAIQAGGRRIWRHAPADRLVRTSSSVAPAATRAKRTALFDRLVETGSASSQDAFHAHRWPADPGASVLMSRPDARTVSVTVVEAFAHGFRLTYRPWPAGAGDVTNLPRAA